ncbi:MAG: hypothetical protein AAF591_13805 [Verrucomicrobiota bacterium]
MRIPRPRGIFDLPAKARGAEALLAQPFWKNGIPALASNPPSGGLFDFVANVSVLLQAA